MRKNTILLIPAFLLFFLTSLVHSQEGKKDLNRYSNIRWTFETNGPVHGSPAEYGQSIFFGSGDHNIYSVNKATGTLQWKYTTGGPVFATPVVDGQVLYCTSMDGNLYALNREDGKLLWKFTSQEDHQIDIWDYHHGSPLVDNDMVYYGNGTGNFFAINKNTGEKVWEVQTGGIIHTTPVVNDENIFFGNFDGVLYAVNKRTGQEAWKFKTIGQEYFPKGEIQQGPSIHDDVLYFGSRDFNLYAVNAKTGTGMWNMYETGSWVIATPTIKDTLVLFGTSDTHHFYAMDARNGLVKWKKKINLNVFGQCETGQELAYFGALNGKIYAVRLADGTTAWEFQTPESQEKWGQVFDQQGKFSKPFVEAFGTSAGAFYGELHSMGSIVSKPLLGDGVLYFTSMNGKVYAIE